MEYFQGEIAPQNYSQLEASQTPMLGNLKLKAVLRMYLFLSPSPTALGPA